MPAASVEDLARARRVLIHGVTGSGKSTAAGRLGDVLGLPTHLVDEEIGWLPGWQQREVTDQRRIAAQLAAGDRWVFDSTYSGFRDLVVARAQVMVGLDYPRRISLGRLLRRTAGRIRDRGEICNGNQETLGQVFSRDSIIVWHFRSFTRKRTQMRAWHRAEFGLPTILLRHPREFDELCEKLRSMTGPTS